MHAEFCTFWCDLNVLQDFSIFALKCKGLSNGAMVLILINGLFRTDRTFIPTVQTIKRELTGRTVVRHKVGHRMTPNFL